MISFGGDTYHKQIITTQMPWDSVFGSILLCLCSFPWYSQSNDVLSTISMLMYISVWP